MTREEAIKYAKFRLECHTKGDGEYTDYGEFLVVAIAALQEPERKKERCEYCKDGKSFIGQVAILGNDATWHKINYCPNCGADMRKSEGRIMTIEIDKNFETILLCAVRYAIGRKTYIPSLVIDYITPLLPYLSENTLRLIANEIIEHDTYEGGLGDEKIDRPYWEQFLRKIRLEMGGRHEP